jgi:hypothetical protein
MSRLEHNPDRRLPVADMTMDASDTDRQAAAGAAGRRGRSDRWPA